MSKNLFRRELSCPVQISLIHQKSCCRKFLTTRSFLFRNFESIICAFVHIMSGANHADPDPVHVTRESILEMIKLRDGIENQIRSLGEILKSNHIGMEEPLTDAEGFPRNDIDVYQVRHARHGIICLQTDFKRLTKQIEDQLEIFYRTTTGTRNGIDGVRMETDESGSNSLPAPIVKVNLVSEGSPAFHAGLRVGDEICSFGSISSDNFSNVQDIGNVVQRSQGQVLTVQVLRNRGIVQLALIPGPWSGRGLLGCNIVPV